MRKTFEPQITFGTVPMSNIKFDIFCRHELVPILMALQHLYFNKPVLNEILDLIKEDIVEDKDEKRWLRMVLILHSTIEKEVAYTLKRQTEILKHI